MVNVMIKIDTRDSKKWEKIEKKHKEWFAKEFENKWKSNKLLYNNLSIEEKKYLKKLFDLETNFSASLTEDMLLKIKEFSICFLERVKISEFNRDYIKIIAEEKDKIQINIKSKIQIINNDNKIKNKYNEFNKWLKVQKYNEKLSTKALDEIKNKNKKTVKILETNFEKIELTNLDFFLKEIFDYNGSFSGINKFKWCRALWAKELDIKVCPYCQRNYITNYHDEGNRNKENKDKTRTTADLDHFYPQSEFPYLALSLYNFIPSCPICNSRFKLKASSYNKNVLYPYIESFDDDIFKTKFTSSLKLVDTLIDGSEDDFIISLESQCNVSDTNKERIEETINMFGLNEIYKTSHNKYLQNMLNNNFKYPEIQAKFIADIFYLGINNSENKKEQDINVLKQGIEQIIIKPYEHKIKEGEPLGKLTKDILEEFGIDIK